MHPAIRKIREEPALAIGALLIAGMNLAAAFGFDLTPEQRQALINFALLATPFVGAAAIWIRQLVSPVFKLRKGTAR